MIKPFNVEDVIATKDGRIMTILTIKYKDGTNDVLRMEAVERAAPSPMRTTIHWDNFRRIIRKAPRVFDADIRRWCELGSDNMYIPIERRVKQERDYMGLFKLRADRRVTKEVTV